MPMAFVFAALMVLWAVSVVTGAFIGIHYANEIVLWILLAMLGYKVFGPLIRP